MTLAEDRKPRVKAAGHQKPVVRGQRPRSGSWRVVCFKVIAMYLQGLGCSSMVEPVLHSHEALGLVLSTKSDEQTDPSG